MVPLLKYFERRGINVNGTVQFGGRPTVTISRNADLIWKCYLQIDLPALAKAGGTVAWTRNIGNSMIDNIEIEIGGQRIKFVSAEKHRALLIAYKTRIKQLKVCSLTLRC